MSIEKWLARAFGEGVESAGRAIIEEGLKALNDQDLEHVKKAIAKIQAERKANVIDATAICGISKMPNEAADDGWYCTRKIGHAGPCAARKDAP